MCRRSRCPRCVATHWPTPVSRYLAPSQNTADHVMTQRVDRERIRVLPWALDPEFEALLPTAAKSPRPKNFPEGRVILTVGRWLATERYKGMDTLITAMPRLLPRYPDLQLVLVGQGDDQDWLSEHADKTGVSSHVHFLSGLSYSQLVSCYAACEIFALPSAAEGFGLVYLEAMACCKPVIAGAHGGAPEVILDGVSGYLTAIPNSSLPRWKLSWPIRLSRATWASAVANECSTNFASAFFQKP